MTRFDELGPNSGLVEELYQRYLENPASVDAHWRTYFVERQLLRRAAGDRTGNGADTTSPRRRVAPGARPKVAPGPMVLDGDEPEPLRGGAARTVENMEASLTVPTATSVRAIPAKLLEVNRQILNNQLERTARRQGELHPPHRVRSACARSPTSRPQRDVRIGRRQAGRRAAQQVNLGFAVDVKRRDGTHSLLVPCVKDADTIDFAELLARVRGAHREGAVGQGVARRLRRHHVHDHQPGDDRHRPLGAAAHARARASSSASAASATPRSSRAPTRTRSPKLGVSKVTTLTNTYDHRIITGAESGEFLRRIHDLLLGDDGFYDDVFASLAVPYEPARWVTDRSAFADPASQNEKVVQVHSLINMYRVRGHLIANLDPLGRREPHDPRGARHHALRPVDLGPRPRVPDRQPRRRASAPHDDAAARHPRRAARRVRAHDRRRVHAHPGARPEGLDPGAGRGVRTRRPRRRRSAASSSGSTRPRRSSASCTPSTSGRSASASRARRRSSRCSTRSAAQAADSGHEPTWCSA